MSPDPAKNSGKRRGDPTVAALLTWFVPGAGHLYIGRAATALLAFIGVGGLYYLGVTLAQGMTFQYLDPELRSRFAPALSPEAGCLGGFLWQIQRFGYGGLQVELFPKWMALGSVLAALAGVLNALLMAHAHWEAQGHPANASPARHVVLAWLVPGLGHFAQGRRRRAVLVCSLLLGLFALGTILAEGTNLSRERHFYYWSGQFLVGLPALVGEWLGRGIRIGAPLRFGDAGLVFACVAGLLNVLAMIDVYAWQEEHVLGRQTSAPSSETAAPTRRQDAKKRALS